MNLVYRIQRRLRIKRTVRELSRLDDNVLLDIGIERGNIAEMVEASMDPKYGHAAYAGPAMYGSTSNNYHLPGGAVA